MLAIACLPWAIWFARLTSSPWNIYKWFAVRTDICRWSVTTVFWTSPDLSALSRCVMLLDGQSEAHKLFPACKTRKPGNTATPWIPEVGMDIKQDAFSCLRLRLWSKVHVLDMIDNTVCPYAWMWFGATQRSMMKSAFVCGTNKEWRQSSGICYVTLCYALLSHIMYELYVRR